MLKKTIGIFFLVFAIVLFLSVLLAISKNPEGVSYGIIPSLIVFFVLFFDVLSFYFLFSGRPSKARFILLFSVVFITTGLMVGYFLMMAYVNEQLKERDYTGVYNDCHKIWAARGLVVEGPNITPDGTQNSIESIRLAFAKGAMGSEVDHYYDVNKKEFIVSHDRPYNLKKGGLLTLEELFSETGEDGYFWLDFKKLRHLNEHEIKTAVQRLDAIAPGDLRKRIYVEGEDPVNLSFFRRAGFNTIMDTHPLSDKNPFAPMVINLYKALFYFGDFAVMAMNYGEINNPIYGSNTQQLMSNIPVFIYHVADDSELLADLLGLASVRVVLMQNHSLNRYGVGACQ
jgi:hypothetical protein